MKPPNYDDTELLPLISDEDIQRRVGDLIGRANSRQLWLLFLDESAIQLPLLMPIEGLPSQPTPEHVARVIDRVRELMGDIGASAIVTVLERYGPPSLTTQDAAWARSLRESCEEHGVSLRAQLLSHRAGVRWIADDDFAAT